MPIYVFRCPCCGSTKECIQSYTAPAPKCSNLTTGEGPLCMGKTMERMASAPAFKVTGFNAEVGYASPRTFTQNHGNGIRTEVRGNPEAFSNGLHG